MSAKKRPNTDSSMYSGTPCDECGGPTLLLRTGSIWCAAEDPHPGGHFVFRIGMVPNASAAKPRAIKPRVIKTQPAATPATVSIGYDDFVEGSDR